MINDLIGKLVADKYRIDSLVSEHKSGDIYNGHHEVLGKPVVIKILSPALAIDTRWVKAFVTEARAAASINHSNVVNTTDFGTDARNITYAVYEQPEGETLEHLLAENDQLPEKRAIDIARQVADAAAAGHSAGVVHGSISPSVVYIHSEENTDTVKVLGFGADPKEVSSASDVQYLAPEQCNAFPIADERSDVYSVGVVLYRLLSGSVPYSAATPAELLHKIDAEPPPPLSAFRRDLHPDVEPILLTAISADPDKRYQQMSAFAEDLSTLAGQSATGEKAVAAAAGTRNMWQTAFIVLAGVTILAGALIYATSTKRTDPTTVTQVDTSGIPVQPIGQATGAQEDSLARLPALTEAEIMAASSAMDFTTGPLAGGGDGFNAWANPGVPPVGAPLNQGLSGAPPVGYVPPSTGQVYTVDPNGGSQFMPQEGSGVILVPVPMNTNTAPRPSPTPRTPAGNANTGQGASAPGAAATPRPLATPPPRGGRPQTPPAAANRPAPSNPPESGSGPDLRS